VSIGIALLLAGGTGSGSLRTAVAQNTPAATPTNLEILVYLGVGASGLGFFIWNLGATKVSAGTLAVMNNAKIPLGILISLVIFRETAEPWRLIACGGLMAFAVWLAEEKK